MNDSSNPPRTPEPSEPEIEKLRAKCSFHEAGHCIVAGHWGVDIYCCLVEREFPGYVTIGGEARFGSTTPFREAAIGWAGALGALAVGKTIDQWRWEIPPLWSAMEACSLNLGVSALDAVAIDNHPQRRRTFKAGVRILERNFSNLKFVAGELIAHGEYRADHDSKGSPIYRPSPGAGLDKIDNRREFQSCDFPDRMPFNLRLACALATKNAVERRKVFRDFTLHNVKLTRAKMGRACSDAWADRVADESLAVDARDGLTLDDFTGFREWRESNP